MVLGEMVGRSTETAVLESALESALEGHGAVVTVAGEPGIGKTRLLEELAARSNGRATVSWGRAHEETGAPAYRPWIDVLRATIADAQRMEDDAAATLFDGDAAHALRLDLSLAAARGESPSPGAPMDTEELSADRGEWLLLEGVAEVLRRRARSRPQLVLLEDLHWADRGSLLLLTHLARGIEGQRILVVASYRDEEVVPGSPLARVLLDLHRVPSCRRIELAGLDEQAVRECLEAWIQPARRSQVNEALVLDVTARTSGNPFFIRQIAGLLESEHLARDRPWALPPAIRDTLERRLVPLAGETRSLLERAALLGREFTVADLRAVSRESDDSLVAALDEAEAARTIEQASGPGRFRFVHALMQEAVAASLTGARRAQLHGEIATALDDAVQQGAAWAPAEIARHSAAAATFESRFSELAARYARRAAEEAESSYAWDEAARHYRTAMEFRDSTAEGDRSSEAELSFRLGRCLARMAEYGEAWRLLLDARALFLAIGDGDQAARAALEAARAPGVTARLRGLISEVFEAVGDGRARLGAAEEARLRIERARLTFMADAVSEADEAEARADAAVAEPLGRDLDLPDVRAQVEDWHARRALIDGDYDEAIARFPRAIAALDAAGEYTEAALAHNNYCQLFFMLGRVGEWQEWSGRQLEYSRERHIALQADNSVMALAIGSVARGDFAAVRRYLGEFSQQNWLPDLMRVHLHEIEGDWGGLEQAMPPEQTRGPSLYRALGGAGRARAFYVLGRHDEARAELTHWIEHLGRTDRRVPMSATAIGIPDEAIALLSPDEQRWAFEWSEYHQGLSGVGDCVARWRGGLALARGDLEEAERLTRAGLAWCEREGLVTEIGRCEQQLADIAARRGRISTAIELHARALARFEAIGAPYYAQRSATRLDEMRAIDPGVARLTPRERQVIAALAAGGTNREIAATLGVSPHTVANHVKSILNKTGLRNRSEAAAFAVAHGLAEGSP